MIRKFSYIIIIFTVLSLNKSRYTYKYKNVYSNFKIYIYFFNIIHLSRYIINLFAII